MNIKKTTGIILATLVFVLQLGQVVFAKTDAELAEEKQVMDRELELRELEKTQYIQLPRCLNTNLARIKMYPHLASKINPYDASPVPIAMPHKISEMYRTGFKNRIALPPLTSDLSDGGKVAILRMLSVVIAGGDAITKEANDLLVAYKATASDPEVLCKALNKMTFNYPVPADKYAAGYRVAIYHDRNVRGIHYTEEGNDHDYALFFRRIKRNIDDGYPIIARVDRSKLYEDQSGYSYIIITGYLELADNKALGAIYFVDPAIEVQHPYWDGLKRTHDVVQFFRAISESDYQAYIW